MSPSDLPVSPDNPLDLIQLQLSPSELKMDKDAMSASVEVTVISGRSILEAERFKVEASPPDGFTCDVVENAVKPKPNNPQSSQQFTVTIIHKAGQAIDRGSHEFTISAISTQNADRRKQKSLPLTVEEYVHFEIEPVGEKIKSGRRGKYLLRLWNKGNTNISVTLSADNDYLIPVSKTTALQIGESKEVSLYVKANKKVVVDNQPCPFTLKATATSIAQPNSEPQIRLIENMKLVYKSLFSWGRTLLSVLLVLTLIALVILIGYGLYRQQQSESVSKIEYFKCVPCHVIKGESAALTWKAVNANSWALDGALLPLTTNGIGKQTVTPEKDHTYYLCVSEVENDPNLSDPDKSRNCLDVTIEILVPTATPRPPTPMPTLPNPTTMPPQILPTLLPVSESSPSQTPSTYTDLAQPTRPVQEPDPTAVPPTLVPTKPVIPTSTPVVPTQTRVSVVVQSTQLPTTPPSPVPTPGLPTDTPTLLTPTSTATSTPAIVLPTDTPTLLPTIEIPTVPSPLPEPTPTEKPTAQPIIPTAEPTATPTNTPKPTAVPVETIIKPTAVPIKTPKPTALSLP